LISAYTRNLGMDPYYASRDLTESCAIMPVLKLAGVCLSVHRWINEMDRENARININSSE